MSGQYGQNQFQIRAVDLGARGEKKGSGTGLNPFSDSVSGFRDFSDQPSRK